MAGNFTPLDRDTLKKRYGAFYQRRTKRPLDPSRVPEELRPIIPYVEIWGVRDDYERDELIDQAPQQAKDDLRALIGALDDKFDNWLAGPEANQPRLSEEYVAFSNLRIAHDTLPDDDGE